MLKILEDLSLQVEIIFALGGYSSIFRKVLLYIWRERGKYLKWLCYLSLISHGMTEGMGGISKVDMAKEAAIRSLES